MSIFNNCYGSGIFDSVPDCKTFEKATYHDVCGVAFRMAVLHDEGWGILFHHGDFKTMCDAHGIVFADCGTGALLSHKSCVEII